MIWLIEENLFMNYLAHLLLGDRGPQWLVGSLMADFVKGRLPDSMDPALRGGIVLHRRIDAGTDAHPEVAACRSLFPPERRRYAGILTDIVFDHYLARAWSRYSGESLDGFAARVTAVLETHREQCPEGMQRLIGGMRGGQRLVEYGDFTAIEAAMVRISRRTDGRVDAAGAIEDLRRHYDELEQRFYALFPDVVALAAGTYRELREMPA